MYSLFLRRLVWEVGLLGKYVCLNRERETHKYL